MSNMSELAIDDMNLDRDIDMMIREIVELEMAIEQAKAKLRRRMTKP